MYRARRKIAKPYEADAWPRSEAASVLFARLNSVLKKAA
jgi:hypothetical protein